MRRPEAWFVSFLEEDCRTPLRPKHFYRVKDVDALRDLARRGNCEDMGELERCILQWGRGSVYLRLTEEQYQRVSVPRSEGDRKPEGDPRTE